MKALLIIIGLLAVLLVIGWLGLKTKPKPFLPYAEKGPELRTVPLASGLPKSVERFYRQLYGENVPVIGTAVINGRGTMRLFNLTIPIRFRFTHETGKNYRHDVELTFFGLPVIKSYEVFVNGKGWAKTPAGIDEGVGMDQGSNVSLWAEALNWFPAVLVTDPQVRWEPVDNTTALLITPSNSGHEVFVVRFDPTSGQMIYVEAMKYRSATGEKMLWINGTWFDEGKPWIHLDVEDVLYNVNVHEYIWMDMS